MLERIRANAVKWLEDKARIEREVVATGSMGEAVRTWHVSAVDVPCRVIRATAGRGDAHSMAGDVESLPEEYRVSLPPGTAVGVDYRLTIRGQVYQVVRAEAEFTGAVFTTVIAVIRP